jgi:hypothetical protein
MKSLFHIFLQYIDSDARNSVSRTVGTITIGCLFKFPVKAGVEESIVNAPLV